jgi:hypothetical protein
MHNNEKAIRSAEIELKSDVGAADTPESLGYSSDFDTVQVYVTQVDSPQANNSPVVPSTTEQASAPRVSVSFDAVEANGNTDPEQALASRASFISELRAKYSQAKQLHPGIVRMPVIHQKQFAVIVEDIRKHGQRLPILTVGGKIVDGEIREAACFVAGVVPWYEEWDGDDDPETLNFSLNVPRRQLNPSQLAVYIADRLLEEERPTQRDAEFANLRKARTRIATKKALAEEKGISPRLVDHALKLKKEAPEELEMVRAGKKNVSKAVAEMKDARPARAKTGSSNLQVVTNDKPVAASTPTGPAQQLMLSWPGLIELLDNAKNLIENPPEHMRSKLTVQDPVTEEYVFFGDPRYSWTVPDLKEQIGRTDAYSNALREIADRLTYERRIVGKHLRAVKEYRDWLQQAQTPPVSCVLKKQPTTQKDGETEQPPEPVKVGGA